MNAKYVLTYSENTDAGDPTSSVSNRFFGSRDAALAALEESIQNSDNILHFLEMNEDDEHYISRSETSCFVVNGLDTMRWEVNEVKVEDKPAEDDTVIYRPLLCSEALHSQETKGYIARLIPMEPEAIVRHGGNEGLSVYFANAIMQSGAEYVTTIQYSPVDIVNGSIRFKVVATIDPETVKFCDTKARYKELLDAVITHKLEETKMDYIATIKAFLKLGFSPEEMVACFDFDPEDVDTAEGELASANSPES